MNIFFLGAGFSKPAGLPLGDSLFIEVLEQAKLHGIYNKELEHDIKEYLEYYYAKNGKEITEDKIRMEEFISYLDINHHLMLHGGDYTASEECYKNLIAYVLYNHEREIKDDQFALYEHFAERLGPNDIIFTFNYDTILENTLARRNMPYRFYQFRHRYDEKANTLILDWKEEITIYKMHGSINWFDKSDYQESKKLWGKDSERPTDAAFDSRMDGETQKLLDEPFPPTDPLQNIYIVKNLGKYFANYFDKYNSKTSQYPFIISPSHHKLISLSYLRDFWYRFSTGIPEVNRISIIGFSLPTHDEYIRQPMYWYIRNFHRHGRPLNGKKSKLKIISLPYMNECL